MKRSSLSVEHLCVLKRYLSKPSPCRFVLLHKNCFNLLIFFQIFFFAKVTFSASSLTDLFYRINLNDHFLAFYYFWWTSSWWLGSFLLLSLLLLTVIFFKQLIGFFLVTGFISVIYFLETSLFFFSNYRIIFLNYYLNDFNPLLFNNLNKYHPYFLYSSVFVLIVVNFFFFFLTPSKFFFLSNSFFFQKKETALFSVFIINFISLFLGGWWASQESSWGGWWNWDASETLGLLVLVISIVFFHNQTFYFNKVNFYFYLLLQFLVFLLAYFFIQLNFELVSHNFGIKFFYFFNSNFFLVELTYFHIFLIFVLLKMSKFLSINFFLILVPKFALKFQFFFKFYVSTLLTSVYAFIIFFSFSLLLNFFFKKFFNLNLINLVPSFELFSFLFCLHLLFFLHKISLTYFFLGLPALLNLPANFVILFSPFAPVSLFQITHFFFFLSFSSIFFSCNTSLLSWFIAPTFNEFFLSSDFFFFLTSEYTLNYFFVNQGSSSILNDFWVSSFSFQNLFIVAPSNNFDLFSSSNGLFNFIRLNLHLTQINLYDEQLFVFSTTFFTVLLIPISLIFFLKNKIV